MLADGAVDAVYVATPHPAHEAQALAAIAAGDTCCGKPMTIEAASTERVIEAARKRECSDGGVHVRCHPLTQGR